MTRERFTRWTCNACQVIEDISGIGQPKGWIGYGFTRPDVPAGVHDDIGHLCPDCAHKVTAATRPPGTEEQAGLSVSALATPGLS